MKLYEITNDMREIHAMIESGELTDDMVADTMDGLNGQFEDKARASLKVRQSLMGDIQAVDYEIERLTKLKKSLQGNCEWLLNYIKMNMEVTGKDKLDLGIFKVTLRKPTMQLGEFKEDQIPSTFFKTIPESRRLDRKALLDAVKSGEMVGVQLIDSKRSLTIK